MAAAHVRSFAAIGLLGLSSLTSTVPAQAATGAIASVDQGGLTVTYTAGAGEDNDLVVTYAGSGEGDDNRYTFDDVVPITPGTRCQWPDEADPTVVTCNLSESRDFWMTLRILTGDGNDRVNMTIFDQNPHVPGDFYVFAGPGNDMVTAAGKTDMAYGEDGDDILTGVNTAHGGAGRDTIRAEEYAAGGTGNDTIYGGNNATIEGGKGNDTISAGPGNDTVYGNSGADLIRGGKGNDRLSGGPGNDTIYGNSGNDRLEGGPGTDRLSGGPGRDTVRQ